MKKMSPEQIKSIMFEVLSVVDDFCRENSLTYFLCGGTLIGSIRHGGFIPWDDDIDISMPRKDYEIFLEKFNSYSEFYKVRHCNNDKTYPFPFAKVSDTRTRYIEQCDFEYNGGVYVDVFPVDEFESLEEANSAYRKCNFYKQSILIKARKAYQKNIIKRVVWTVWKFLISPISPNKFARKIEAKMIKHSNKRREKTEYMGCVVWGYGRKEIVDAKYLSSVTEHKFETRNMYVPSGYNEFLTSIYGDYMKLPPEDKRVPHHSTEAFFL